MRNKKIKIATVAMMTLVVFGCDNNSKDPMKDYRDLQDDVPPQERVVRNQEKSVCSSQIVLSPTMVVTEGESVSQSIFVNGEVSDGEKLEIKNSQKGLTVIPKGRSKGSFLFTLSYTPAVGTIDVNQNFKATEIEILNSSQGKNLVQCPEKVGLVVTRTNRHPVITKVGVDQKIDLSNDKVASITLDVKASGLSGADRLRILSGYDFTVSSKENPIYDLSLAIRQKGEIRKVSDGIYRVQFDISKPNLKLLVAEIEQANPKAKLAKHLEMLVQFSAYNKDARLESPAENVVVQVIKAAESAPSANSKTVNSEVGK